MIKENKFCILISQKIIRDMFEYAEEGSPQEVCGILSGCGNKIKKIYKMENTDKGNNSYCMNPEQQFDVIRKIRLDKQEMLAIFHSHPTSLPEPSEKDIDMAFYPECVYLIISLTGRMFAHSGKQKIKGFRISEREIKEVQILYE